MTLCHKLWFSNPYIFGFQRRKPLKFKTMTFVRSKNISLKYQRFHWVPKILGLENQSLWQRVNSFPYILLHFRNYQHNSLHFITFQRASAHFLTFYCILVNISIVFKNDFLVVKNETIVLRTSFSFKWKSDCTFS